MLPTPVNWGRIETGHKAMAELAAPAGFMSSWDAKKDGVRKVPARLAIQVAESYRYESVATSTTGRDTIFQQN